MQDALCGINPLFTLSAMENSLYTRTAGSETFTWSTAESVALCGLVVSVLATGPKVRGFNPGRGRWTFKADKNP
jgi:hypothetical protein